jgi:hypothetical protein
LTGPAFLSALATLSANVRHMRQAFFLGICWGIGHTTGLLLVRILMIVLSARPSNDDDAIGAAFSTSFDSLVGVFMIFLGVYGIRRAWTRRYPAVPSTPEEEVQPSIPMHLVHSTTTRKPTCVDLFLKCTGNVSSQTMALLAGIVHGLAGPGIFFFAFFDGHLLALYVSYFCIASTLTMSIFAGLYGFCSSRLVYLRRQPFVSGSYRVGVWEFRIECASACLSIIVGVLWLILLSTGKLHIVFP